MSAITRNFRVVIAEAHVLGTLTLTRVRFLVFFERRYPHHNKIEVDEFVQTTRQTCKTVRFGRRLEIKCQAGPRWCERSRFGGGHLTSKAWRRRVPHAALRPCSELLAGAWARP